MALQIIKGTEAIAVDHPIFLIMGEHGMTKTSLGYSAPAPLLWDFDKGAHRAVNRRDTLRITSWADALEATDDDREGYKTDVIDTVGRAVDFLTADIATDPKKARGGGELNQQGWGALKHRFRSWISALRSQGRDIVLLAHAKEEKDGDTRIFRPDIAGSSMDEVLRIADFVGFLHMVGKDRVLDFNPTDRWVGKNPAGWAPFIVPPADKAQTFMADLMQKGREALGHISAESAAVLEQVEQWKTVIAGVTDAMPLTMLVAEAVEIPQKPIQVQVRRALADRAKALGLVWDKTAKEFKPAAPSNVVPMNENMRDHKYDEPVGAEQ